MTIHFFCSKCGEELLVEDVHAGKQVRCPKCTTVLDVPGQTNFPLPSDPQYNPNDWQQANSVSTNPYESPRSVNELGNPLGSDEAGLKLTNVYTKPLLKSIFRFYGRFFFPLVLWGVVLFLCSLSVDQIVRRFPDSFVPIFISCGSGIILFLLNICFYQYVINLAKKGQYSLENAFPSGLNLFRTFLGHIVFFLICMLYTFLFILAFAVLAGIGAGIQQGAIQYLPDHAGLIGIVLMIAGIVIGIVLVVALIKVYYERGFFLFFILDRNKGIMDSFAASIRYARGIDRKTNFNSYINASILIFIPILIFAIVLMGMVFGTSLTSAPSANFNEMVHQMEEPSLMANAAQFFISNIVAMPLYYSLMTMMYFLMTGQPTVLSGMLARHFDHQNNSFHPASSQEPENQSADPIPLQDEKKDIP